MHPRARRLLRGWTGAVLATAVAAASHVAGGGPAPAPMLVLLSLALSGPVCTALAGRVLSRSAVAAGVLVSQGVFHLLFAGTGEVVVVSGDAHHAAPATEAGGPTLVLAAEPHAAHDGTTMVALHVLAAAATYGLIRHGEVSAVRVLDSLRMRARRLWQVASCPLVAHRPRPVTEGRSPVLTDQERLRPALSYRGPPERRHRGLGRVLRAAQGVAPARAG